MIRAVDITGIFLTEGNVGIGTAQPVDSFILLGIGYIRINTDILLGGSPSNNLG